ncbi:CDK5 regulatory subunit-associated protein 3, partial [Lonchura striata]
MDWLQDRRHCGCRWPAQVAQVRERIRAALQDMPEHPEIRALLQGSYLHYFHCLRIVEILKGTEASTKNLFGRYSSQRMKVGAPSSSSSSSCSSSSSSSTSILLFFLFLLILVFLFTLPILLFLLVLLFLLIFFSLVFFVLLFLFFLLFLLILFFLVLFLFFLLFHLHPPFLPLPPPPPPAAADPGVCPQDWQEIVSLYEKDNAYL